MSTPRLILASSSPRRRELLHEAGFDFEVHPADIDEDDYPPQTLPADLAMLLAGLKADALAARFPQDVILAADTVVAFGDQSLGKPADAAAATAMLKLLAGTTHVVITGVAVLQPAKNHRRIERCMSAVRMRQLSDRDVDRYVLSNDWQGKAGGYGIQDHHQGQSDPFVKKIHGSFSNIVGLPIKLVITMLHDVGIKPVRPTASAAGH